MSTHRRRCLIFITLAGICLFSMITVHHSKATIRKNKYVCSKKTEEITSISSRVCQVNHEHLEDLYKVRLEPLPTQDRTKLFKEVATGGQWAPTSCKPRDHVAIIIPYRDRQEHLDILLQNLHPFLQSQKCHYQIFVIEQALPEPYNLGYTRNVGFVEASAVFNFTCYIFQDVDKIPVNNSLLYRCPPDRVLHFSSAEDRYQYRLRYPKYIGGVLGLAPGTFKKINGFPNNYIRWGGEDDDFYLRSVFQRVPIEHASEISGVYRVLNHSRLPGYANSEKRRMVQFAAALYWHHGPWDNGLNTLNYTRLALEYRPTYTWIKFNFDQNNMMKTVWKGIMDDKYDEKINITYWAINYTRAQKMFPETEQDLKLKMRTTAT